MKENFEIRAAARESLRGWWTSFVLATFVLFLISLIFSGNTYVHNSNGINPTLTLKLLGIGLFKLLGAIFIVLPLSYGFNIIFLQLVRKDETLQPVKDMFVGFNNYARTLGVTLLMVVYVFLWSLLLFVPGIIKSYSYAMTFFIANDNPELSADECIEKSMAMMEGHKFDLFLLDLSFIGWIFLTIFTLGIGMFWVSPYMTTSRAVFYEELKLQEIVE